MSDISQKIRDLEKTLSISNISPFKIVGGFVAVLCTIIIGYILWSKPDFLCNEKREFCYVRFGQFILASTIFLLCVGWLIWGYIQG